MKQILSFELDSHFNFHFSMTVSVIFFISAIKCDSRDAMRVKREIEVKKEKGQKKKEGERGDRCSAYETIKKGAISILVI